MKIAQIIFTLFLLCYVAVCFTFSQQKSSIEKNKKTVPKPIEVKANVMVLDTENKFVDDIKVEDLKVFEDGVEQKITYLAKRPNSLNLGIIVDNSGSMRYVLDETISLGKSIVSNLNDEDEAFVVRFVNSDKIEVEEEWTSDQTKLKIALENMYIEGGQSAVTDAIYLCGEKISEREKENSMKKYALIVISDGEDRDSYYKYNEMMSVFQNTNIQVFVLSYAFQAPLKPKAASKFAGKIVFETGGTVINFTKKRTNEDLMAGLKALITELRSQYVIGYISTNQKYDGKIRALKMEVTNGKNSEKRNAFIRQNFIPVE